MQGQVCIYVDTMHKFCVDMSTGKLKGDKNH